MDIFEIVEIVVIVFLVMVLYFGTLRKGIKLLICREKVTGVISDYKKRIIDQEPRTNTTLHKYELDDRVDINKAICRPICSYTYKGVKYNEVVDFTVTREKYPNGAEIEFYICAKNPKLAVKTNVSEIISMLVIGLFVCAYGIGFAQQIGIIDSSLKDLGLRVLGAVFIGLYIYNLVSYVILPIKEGVFSKGFLDILFWVYMTIAMLTVGTIFLVLGVCFMMGEEQAMEIMKFIKDNVKLKI